MSKQKEWNIRKTLQQPKEDLLDKVKDSLSRYPSHHHYYSFYTEYEKGRFEGKPFYIFFGNAEKWPDKADKRKYESKEFTYFVRCLSSQTSESIAMWHMYGYGKNVRVCMPGAILRNGLHASKKKGEANKKPLKASLLYKIKETEGDHFEDFDLDPSKIECFDMLYYSKNKNDDKYLVQKGDFKRKNFEAAKMKVLLGEQFCKRYAFASEVETRYQIKMTKDEIKEILKSDSTPYEFVGLYVYLDLSKDNQKKIEITKRPDFVCSKDKGEEFIKHDEYPSVLYKEGIPVKPSELDEVEEMKGPLKKKPIH